MGGGIKELKAIHLVEQEMARAAGEEQRDEHARRRVAALAHRMSALGHAKTEKIKGTEDTISSGIIGGGQIALTIVGMCCGQDTQSTNEVVNQAVQSQVQQMAAKGALDVIASRLGGETKQLKQVEVGGKTVGELFTDSEIAVFQEQARAGQGADAARSLATEGTLRGWTHGGNDALATLYKQWAPQLVSAVFKPKGSKLQGLHDAALDGGVEAVKAFEIQPGVEFGDLVSNEAAEAYTSSTRDNARQQKLLELANTVHSKIEEAVERFKEVRVSSAQDSSETAKQLRDVLERELQQVEQHADQLRKQALQIIEGRYRLRPA